MCCRPDMFVGADAATDHAMRVMLGWGVEPSSGVLGHIDPLEDESARPEGESEHGIALRKHPQALLRDDPALWGVWALFRAGARPPATADGVRALSAFEADALLIMAAAESRQNARDMKDG